LLTPQPGDENIYYYTGKLISDGKVPYGDFLFVHPPLHGYLTALVYGLFGFNIFILKSVPLISILISAFLIFMPSASGLDVIKQHTTSSLFLLNSLFDITKAGRFLSLERSVKGKGSRTIALCSISIPALIIFVIPVLFQNMLGHQHGFLAFAFQLFYEPVFFL